MAETVKVPIDPLSDSVLRSDQLLQEISGTDQLNHFKTDFIGPLHRFPMAADWIARLSQKMDRGLNCGLTTVHV